MRTQQLDPIHDPRHDWHPDPGRWDGDVDDDEWYPPGAASAALTGHAFAFCDRLDAALCDYAGAVTTALACQGLPARVNVAAGCDLATIELTIPALAGVVTDGCVKFSDDAGWHYLPAGGPQWARLVPLTAGVTAAQLAPAPALVAAAITALVAGTAWSCAAPGEPTALDALAGPWLDALLAVLDAHHSPTPRGAGHRAHAAV